LPPEQKRFASRLPPQRRVKPFWSSCASHADRAENAGRLSDVHRYKRVNAHRAAVGISILKIKFIALHDLVRSAPLDMLCPMNGKNSRREGSQIESLESRRLLAITGLPFSIGDVGFDTGKRIVPTPDGGFIEAGIFSGTVDFAPGSQKKLLTSKGDSDVFIAKYNSSGKLVWVDQFGGTAKKNKLDKQDAIDIAADPTRAGGTFVNGVSADPSQVAEYVNDLRVAPNGSIYFVGNFIGSVDFDPGPGTKIFKTFDDSFYDAYVVKLTSTGSLTWADQFGGQFTDTAASLALDPTGNVYVTGLFTRTVSFVPGNSNFTLNAVGRADGYVMKLNTTGKLTWIDQFGGNAVGASDRDAGQGIALDSSGNVYVVGTIAGKSNFTSTSGPKTVVLGNTHAGTDGFVAKYTNAGGLVKTILYTGRNYEAVNGIAIDSHNNIAITGYFNDDTFNADPDPGQTHNLTLTPPEFGNSNLPDVFVEEITTSLTFKWVDQISGNGNEFADQIMFDNGGSIIIGGSFYDEATFGPHGPTITSVASTDSFNDINDNSRENSYDPYVWKIKSTGKTEWVKSFGGASDDFGAGIGILPDDSILFTGRFRKTVNFNTQGAGPRMTGLGLGDVFVTGFDSNGVPLFA
jgi:hypothetical protein